MVLNRIAEVIINLLSGIPHLLAFYLLFNHYKRHKDKIIFALMITWLAYGFFWISNGLAYLYLSTEIFRYNKIFLIIASYALIFSFDYMMHERINPFELSFITLFSGLILFTIFDDESVIIENLSGAGMTVSHNGVIRNIITMLGLFLSAVYLYYTFRIYSHSTDRYKKYALLLFIGSVIFGPLVIISFFLEWEKTLPGLTALFSGIGVLLTTIAIQKSPQLIYLLSVKAIKLSIIDEESGLTIYSYDWSPDLIHVEETLISSVIKSISSFTQEVFQKGQVREINLSESIIYIIESKIYNLHFILISNNRSKVLERNLSNFVRMFTLQFESQLINMSKPAIETSEFNNVNSLIPIAFPYIPSN